MNEAHRPPLQEMTSQIGEDAPLLSTKVFFSALSFFLFGAGAMLLSVTAFPLLYLLPVSAQMRKRWSRRVIAVLFPSYIRFMELCGLIKLTSWDSGGLGRGGQLIVANHPSLLDVVYMIASVENAVCVVKPALFRNPITALVVRTAGYIANDSPRLVEDCALALEAGESVIIFPEGTRTDQQRPFKFLRGAANIALRARCDICPVVIRCHPARLMKNQRWYKMAKEPLSVTIEKCHDIRVAPYEALGLSRSVLSRRITTDLEDFYAGQ
jgi:1-acyl-sn-glycerol-3-phosphate acyltransferase